MFFFQEWIKTQMFASYSATQSVFVFVSVIARLLSGVIICNCDWVYEFKNIVMKQYEVEFVVVVRHVGMKVSWVTVRTVEL